MSMLAAKGLATGDVDWQCLVEVSLEYRSEISWILLFYAIF